MDKLFDRLQMLEDRYEELGELLSDPDVISDTKRFTKLSKEMADLRETVEKYNKYKEVTQQISDDEEMLSDGLDDEMASLVKEELSNAKDEKVKLEEEIKILLLPKDPNDDKNIIMEIRGAAGGDEASLFAADLFSMYSKYAERQGWSIEVIDKNVTEVGGFKEIALIINGNSVWSKLKYESGAHRVQRIPVTESAGRVHTSTATVVVMPEEEDVEIELDPKDIRVDVYRSSGAGGQHINKTSSAVRLTHIPTGIVVSCQNERSQFQNKDMCMKMLKAKLYELKLKERGELLEGIRGEVKDNAWGSQIRSYVFHPYNMVKDHRTSAETGNVQAVMDGGIDMFINAYLKWINELDTTEE